ncbi:hypothetical protein RSAG8_02453, partial [Rhizoctonia solani AG-8 WAC10335]
MSVVPKGEISGSQTVYVPNFGGTKINVYPSRGVKENAPPYSTAIRGLYAFHEGAEFFMGLAGVGVQGYDN